MMDRQSTLRTASQPAGTLSREEAVRLLNPHFLRYVELPPLVELFTVPPEFLVSASRFDVVAKSLYGRALLAGTGCRFGEELYTDHIRAFNNFREDDGNKGSREEFLASFNSLLRSVAQKGFDHRVSVVPIGANNEVIDGGHRVAAALVCGKPVTVARFPEVSAHYDHIFFRNRGMAPCFMDATALEFCRLDPSSRMFVLWPSAVGNQEKVWSALSSYGSVLYSKCIALNANGALNLVRQIYAGEPWLGDQGNGFAGGQSKVKQCFRSKEAVRLFLVGGMDHVKSRELKDEIRRIFAMGNDSVHSADSHEETVGLAQSLFNDNSVHLLNHRVAADLLQFRRLLDTFTAALEHHGLDSGSFCIDTGGVLAAYGLREPTDLDYLSCSREPVPELSPEISDHDSQLRYHRHPKEEIVFDPRLHFLVDGIKFASLRVVREMKRKRAESKDWYDIVLIDRVLGVPWPWIFLLRLVLLAKRVSDRWARRVRLKLAGLRHFVADLFVPFIRTVHYCGCDVFYSKGTSLVQRILDTGVYEAETCRAIAAELARCKDPIFLDVGANIGLISLKVLADVPGAAIHAFEPGAHQNDLFRRTIEENKLQSRISLYSEALGDLAGEKSFSIHNTKDASGDGFVDTGRAGEAKTATVQVTTLDCWAERSGVSPRVIKIDTEGAELWVLQGGDNFITREKPVMFLEISSKNLRAYPYTHEDIVAWLRVRGYRLYTVGGVPVDEVTLPGYLDSEDTFVARAQ